MIALGWSRWRLNAGLRKTFSSRVRCHRKTYLTIFGSRMCS